MASQASIEKAKRAVAELKRSLLTIKTSQVFLDRLKAKYESIEKAMRAAQEIHAKVAERLRPDIQREFAISYHRNGVGVDSGDLFGACVTNIKIKADARGILCQPGDGYDRHVYVRLEVFDHGAVYGAKGIKAGTKKKIKGNVTSGSAGGGVHVREAKPVFDLSEDQRQAIYAKYMILFQQEFDRKIGIKSNG